MECPLSRALLLFYIERFRMTKKKNVTWSSGTINAGTNAKTVKGDSEYLTAVMYLAPFNLSGVNVCAMAELAQCHAPCLNTAGRGQFTSIQNARIKKTKRFSNGREDFLEELFNDTRKFINFAKKRDMIPAIRLNGTSDIRWENHKIDGKHIFDTFPDTIFYDYTKIANRKTKDIKNYHLTWSYSAANPAYEKGWKDAIAKGMNVAVVFRKQSEIPTKFLGLPVISGDDDDLRFLDPKDHVISLYAKGKAKKDTSGFVVDVKQKVSKCSKNTKSLVSLQIEP